MAKISGIYTRLARPTAGLASYNTLWLAPDHLLLVESTGFTETYQRVQLTDIQGFFITQSSRRLIGTLVWAPLALLFAAVFAINTFNSGFQVFSGIGFGITALLLTINLLKGPTCDVYLKTRVQTARLQGLLRLRKANRVLGQLKPLIDKTQAGFTNPVEMAQTEPPPIS